MLSELREQEIIFKALANHRRLSLLAYLKHRKRASVGELAAHLKLSFGATSRHLSLLVRAGFLDSEQKGLQVYYYILPVTGRFKARFDIC